jgi:hypothetical protein
MYSYLLHQARAFFKVEENVFAFKTHWASRGIVTHDRRIGSRGGFLKNGFEKFNRSLGHSFIENVLKSCANELA